jgi:hypothetical protein
MWGVRNACSVLVVKSGRKSPVERPKHGWNYNTKMDLKDVVWK